MLTASSPSSTLLLAQRIPGRPPGADGKRLPYYPQPVGIPGRTCEFDLPLIRLAPPRSGVRRRTGRLARALAHLPIDPVLLKLLRFSGPPRRLLPSAICTEPSQGLTFLCSPPITLPGASCLKSASPLMFRCGYAPGSADDRLHTRKDDATFELTLGSLIPHGGQSSAHAHAHVACPLAGRQRVLGSTRFRPFARSGARPCPGVLGRESFRVPSSAPDGPIRDPQVAVAPPDSCGPPGFLKSSAGELSLPSNQPSTGTVPAAPMDSHREAFPATNCFMHLHIASPVTTFQNSAPDSVRIVHSSTPSRDRCSRHTADSSSSSRRSACHTVSPASIFPPGNSQ